MIPKVDIIQNPDKAPDYDKIFRDSFIDINEKIKPQPIAISIGENYYKGNSYPVPFATYGNYSCIVAPSKSKKSFFKSALIAAYIGGNSVNYFPNIRGHRRSDAVIVDIDTEQSNFDAQKVFRRVKTMSGSDYSFYFPFALRRYKAKERMQFVEWLFNEWDYRNDIGLMSIDGYAHLVSDFNNLEQSNELTENLMKWTDEKQCHITGILHSNFGSDKPVGHIGSFTLKMAETVVYLTSEEGIERQLVKVDADKYSRNKPFDSFKFFINDEWLPQSIETETKMVF